jgi:hypothetical protein
MDWFSYDLFSCKRRHQHVFTNILFIFFCFYFDANVIVLILSPKKKLTFFSMHHRTTQEWRKRSSGFYSFGLLTHLFHHFSAYFLCFMLSAMCKVIRIFFQVLNGVINVSSQFASSVAVGETTQCTADQRT